jgi:hypothetical protein
MLKSRPSVIALALMAACASASAESLRCRSVNGNVTCSGSGAVSCQTINGRTVCVGGHGDVVQSFGGGPAPDVQQPDQSSPDEALGGEEPDEDVAPSPSEKPRPFIRKNDASGAAMTVERSEGRLRLRSGNSLIDLEQ